MEAGRPRTAYNPRLNHIKIMLLSVLATPILLAAALPQEEIILNNGKVLEVERITGETFSEVTYKSKSGGSGRKPAEQVREIRHNLGPTVLNEYATAIDLMNAEDYVAALQVFNDVLSDERLLNSKRYAWVKGDSLYRQIKCMFSLADFAGAAAGADKLLAEVPNSFYYASASLVKAEALELAGNTADATSAFNKLSYDVVEKNLPQRWGKQAELGLILLDKANRGGTLRRKLEGLIATVDGKYPTVANRAKVEIGNTFIDEENFDKARKYFGAIVDGGEADAATEAAAFLGLGLCDYRAGLLMSNQDKAVLAYFSANLNFLRVVVMYKDNVALVPKSMYHSAMCFNRSGGDNRAKAVRMAGRMLKRYPNSQWTKKVKQDLNLR